MGTRVSYPAEVKMKAIEMKLLGIPAKQIMDELNIKNVSQLKTWMKWYKTGEIHRLHQPVGKQYSFGKGPEFDSEESRLQTENRYLKQQVEVLKKVQGIGKEVVGQAFVELVEALRGQISVQRICELMGVARATYYRWRKQKGTQTTKEKRDQDVGEKCAAHKYRYGYRKIASFFPNLAEKTVQKIMQKYNWSCRVKVKKRKRTGQPTSIAPNHLERNFHATEPLQKLVTDITYLPFGQSMLYLSSIMDLYNGEIIAYTIGTTQDTLFVLDTLNQVEGISSEAILHSDQGSVYTSYEYQKQVKEKGITMSMSRKGTPADNSPIETFHSSLKSETFYLDGIHSTTNACVIRIVEEYINYYNNIRIQTKLNNQSPVQYRQLAV